MKSLLYCAFGTAALLAACSTDDGVQISDEEYDDIASSVASTTSQRSTGGGGELGAMGDVTVLARGGILPGFAIAEADVWVGEHLGVTYRYDFECRDRNGKIVLGCGASTDRADVLISWTGSLELPLLTIDLERDGRWIVGGLSSNTAVVDGEGHLDVETHFEHQDRGISATYQLSYDADYDAIVFERGYPFPRSGTIEYSLDVDRTRVSAGRTDEQHFDVDAEVVFETNNHATITLDGDHRYDLDLATGVTVRI